MQRKTEKNDSNDNDLFVYLASANWNTICV